MFFHVFVVTVNHVVEPQFTHLFPPNLVSPDDFLTFIFFQNLILAGVYNTSIDYLSYPVRWMPLLIPGPVDHAHASLLFIQKMWMPLYHYP